MKKSTEEAKKAVTYEVKVTRAREFENGSVSFDIEANDVSVYGCWYREYTNKEGQEGTLLSFPSQKGKDGKYYNHAWFPINAELKEEIIEQISKLV